MKDGGRLLTLLGLFMIVVSLVVPILLLAREIPPEVATWWTLWNVFVALCVMIVGVCFVVWGRRVANHTRSATTRDDSRS
jgi:type VI protein secretion system component VasK